MKLMDYLKKKRKKSEQTLKRDEVGHTARQLTKTKRKHLLRIRTYLFI